MIDAKTVSGSKFFLTGARPPWSGRSLFFFCPKSSHRDEYPTWVETSFSRWMPLHNRPVKVQTFRLTTCFSRAISGRLDGLTATPPTQETTHRPDDLVHPVAGHVVLLKASTITRNLPCIIIVSVESSSHQLY